ncbi:MAG: hypothetical protein SGI92_32265 [Bryobacteraceae bacterium]|nr:hypothetical protein [Bryobacteraceae bacterium]
MPSTEPGLAVKPVMVAGVVTDVVVERERTLVQVAAHRLWWLVLLVWDTRTYRLSTDCA